MDELRERIDILDEQLMESLLTRFLIVKEIGEYKKENDIPILDSSREQDIYDKIAEEFFLIRSESI